MKLHLGCGEIHLNDGWINIDRRYQPGVDKTDNIFILNHYENVDEIYICHAIDHCTRWDLKNVLRRYHEILRPGGVIRIATPDFAWTANRYLKTGKLEELTGQLYAAQDYPDNVRHWMWDLRLASLTLREIGFSGVETYDPREFLEWQPKDCSVLADEDGNLRSLCVRATK